MDGRTDGQTDEHLCSGYTSACIACYANALVMINVLHGKYFYSGFVRFALLLHASCLTSES